jgi:hypothetical protein
MHKSCLFITRIYYRNKSYHQLAQACRQKFFKPYSHFRFITCYNQIIHKGIRHNSFITVFSCKRKAYVSLQRPNYTIIWCNSSEQRYLNGSWISFGCGVCRRVSRMLTKATRPSPIQISQGSQENRYTDSSHAWRGRPDCSRQGLGSQVDETYQRR